MVDVENDPQSLMGKGTQIFLFPAGQSLHRRDYPPQIAQPYRHYTACRVTLIENIETPNPEDSGIDAFKEDALESRVSELHHLLRHLVITPKASSHRLFL